MFDYINFERINLKILFLPLTIWVWKVFWDWIMSLNVILPKKITGLRMHNFDWEFTITSPPAKTHTQSREALWQKVNVGVEWSLAKTFCAQNHFNQFISSFMSISIPWKLIIECLRMHSLAGLADIQNGWDFWLLMHLRYLFLLNIFLLIGYLYI